MKKSELTQLTQIIEVLVTKEIRKQLPKLIGEVFSNMAGKTIVGENVRKEYIGREVEVPTPKTDPHEFRSSLKELFTGATPVTRAELEEGVQPAPRPMINFAKDPVLNQILNETTPDLRSRERMTGMAAMQGGYNTQAPVVGAGPMMSEAEMPSFARGMPPMQPVAPQGAPVAQPIQEGHVPLQNIPEGVSALDVARAGMITDAPVAAALTNYDRMRKILEASKGKRY